MFNNKIIKIIYLEYQGNKEYFEYLFMEIF